LSFVFTFGTTNAKTTAITNAIEATTKYGRVNPPTLYRAEPKAGPKSNRSEFNKDQNSFLSSLTALPQIIA